MDLILNELENRFGVTNRDERRNDLSFATVGRQTAVEVITWLRDYAGFRHLVMISAVDYPERDSIQLTYLLHNHQTHKDIGLRVVLDRREKTMDSIHHLWAGAQVYQRELREMFGIDFPGSPGVDKPMILEGWREMPPMLKEFDTKKYSEETYFPRPGRFTMEPQTVMENKLYPIETEVKNGIRSIVRDNRSNGGA
ncbi:MAG TPA: NADH-quinone oxidoreductase subunit C [Caldithrix abyssi]|uniref:NADH-quinone oxidoreductase subunit C n=1 Tax=Caldithrix abyssi TaxID=187145 RepID=A0A7V1LXY1_CALAY|nr:NADH-quinone oxidoreductase subunit C [Caldithrix abyssi]